MLTVWCQASVWRLPCVSGRSPDEEEPVGVSRSHGPGGSKGAPFADRRHAGRALAAVLLAVDASQRRSMENAPPSRSILTPSTPPVVLALPRGGVPVGFEVATALNAPLDVLIARKIGVPGNPELGMGAVAEGGVRVFSDDVLQGLLISQEELERSAFEAETEMRRRAKLYRGERAAIALDGATAIIVDDGLATGSTARAAILAARARGAIWVVLAMPVGAPSTVEALEAEADAVVCLLEPEPMWAIGMWYRDFKQVPDHEVLRLLGPTRERAGASPSGTRSPPSQSVQIPHREGASTFGELTLPEGCKRLVLFAHGSGSGRNSPRNRQVAETLHSHGIATLLLDLLTPEEERLRTKVFDIPLLASRLRQATLWARSQPQLGQMPIGYFGASTGAAAALLSAADLGGQVSAIVSRGGRPDLAASRLPEIAIPVLLIVGGADVVVLDLNRQALRLLDGNAKLEVIPGATHLFEEPGALEEVSRLASDWLSRHLVPSPGPSGSRPWRRANRT